MLYPEVLVILILTMINGMLALSELAIVSSRRSRLEHLANQGNAGAKKALLLHDQPSRFLSTVQIGITLVGVVAGAYSGVTLGEHLGKWLDTFPQVHPHGKTAGIGLTVLGITYLSLILGELVPKRIALSQPERIAAMVAGPMRYMSIAAAPAVWLLHVSTEGVLRVLQLSRSRDSTITEDEVKSLIDEGTQAGVFVPQEQEMIEGVLRLADRPVRVVMTPRSELVWIDAAASLADAVSVIETDRYSRLLVCEESVDKPLGVVHTKDLLPAAMRGNGFSLAELMKPVLFVPDRTSVLELLNLFKREKLHLAIVVDEYGTTEGLATLTDVLESIAGDLPERGDDDEPRILRREDGSWLVDGTLPTDEIESVTGINMGEEVQTMASFMLHHLARMPELGAKFTFSSARFEIVDMDGKRIDKVLIEVKPPRE